MAALTTVGVHSDGGGLYLRVRETGSRSWLFVCTISGKRRDMGLGSDLDVSLSQAREKAEAARALVLGGKDPQADRAQAKVPVELPLPSGSLRSSGWMAWRAASKREASAAVAHYADNLCRPLFSLAVSDITTDAVVAVLKPIWLSKAETASRLRGRIERVLDAAKARNLRQGENPARARGHLDILLPKRPKTEVRHHPALPFGEVAAFITELRQRQAIAARALEFTVLTAARSGETRGMTWAEVDLDQRLWTVPATRMKAGETHQVPLSDAAMAILRAVKPAKIEPTALVFPAQRGGVMSDMAMSQLLKRMNRGDITVHGFRSAFRDWAGEKTHSSDEKKSRWLWPTLSSQRLSAPNGPRYSRG